MCENETDIPIDEETRARLERLTSGCVLVANDSLRDPNFDHTVVLVCVYSEDGAYGVVVNRPSHMPLSEMFDGYGGMQCTRTVYIGGPVRQDEPQILQVTDSPAENAYRVAHRVYLGGEWENLQRLLESDEEHSHLFLGYSGWAPGQLEYEVIAGAWEVHTVDVERFLSAPSAFWTGPLENIRKHLHEVQP